MHGSAGEWSMFKMIAYAAFFGTHGDTSGIGVLCGCF